MLISILLISNLFASHLTILDNMDSQMKRKPRFNSKKQTGTTKKTQHDKSEINFYKIKQWEIKTKNFETTKTEFINSLQQYKNKAGSKTDISINSGDDSSILTKIKKHYKAVMSCYIYENTNILRHDINTFSQILDNTISLIKEKCDNFGTSENNLNSTLLFLITSSEQLSDIKKIIAILKAKLYDIIQFKIKKELLILEKIINFEMKIFKPENLNSKFELAMKMVEVIEEKFNDLKTNNTFLPFTYSKVKKGDIETIKHNVHSITSNYEHLLSNLSFLNYLAGTNITQNDNNKLSPENRLSEARSDAKKENNNFKAAKKGKERNKLSGKI